MKTSDFDYYLPPDRIAQFPVEPRDSSRLLVVHRRTGVIEHRIFRDLVEYIQPNDVLVANDSKVIPARLRGQKTTGGQVEVLLLRQLSNTRWETLIRGKNMTEGSRINMLTQSGHEPVPALQATVVEVNASQTRILEFNRSINEDLGQLGEMPLPPYIHESLANPDRYQTVFSRVQGSAAAPTAGLHFTPQLIEKIKTRGSEFAFTTLHVGLDTFRPIQVEDTNDHHMHTEWIELPEQTAKTIKTRREQGGRCIAVGTTSVRVLESAARKSSFQEGFSGWTDLFITPGFQFLTVDALITNFHLPRSTLLMMISAFAGQELIMQAYQVAIEENYRFYSFGDAMLIL